MFGGKHVFYWNIKDIASIVVSAAGVGGYLWIVNKSMKSEEEKAADAARREESLLGKVKKKIVTRIEDRFDL